MSVGGRRPKRPARLLGKGVPVRFPDPLIMQVKRLADRDGMTVSAWIRNVVTREVARRGPTPTTVGRAEGIEFYVDPPAYATSASEPELSFTRQGS